MPPVELTTPLYKRTSFLLVVGGLAVLVVGAYIVFTHYRGLSGNPYATQTVHEVLVADNPYFAQAQQAWDKLDYQQVIASYQAALPLAKDQLQKSQIELELADAKSSSGDRIGAIQMDKTIVANTTYSNMQRAYAVLLMENTYVDSLDGTLLKEIFKDAPYTRMWVEGDTDLSLRHLFEYASTFYPLAIPELKIADWYARHLTTTSTQARKDEYLGIIREKFAHAEADNTRIAGNSNVNHWVPVALRLEAVTKGRLAAKGLWDAKDAEAQFSSALDAYTSGKYLHAPGDEGYWYLNYAYYLISMYKGSRDVDVHKALAHLSDPVYRTAGIEQYLKSVPKTSASAKAYVVTIAKHDPAFQDFLISLDAGWKKIDFK